MPQAPPSAPSRGKPSLRLVLWVCLGVIVDQITKIWAHAELRGRGIVTVVEGFFDLRYSRNPGAFFSLGANLPDGIRRGFFIVASLLAIGLIYHIYRQARPDQRALRAALGLLLAGAFGNLIDRARAGEVIDFLHLHWYDVFHWATFNVADIYITFGLILLLVDMWSIDVWKKTPTESPRGDGAEPRPNVRAPSGRTPHTEPSDG